MNTVTQQRIEYTYYTLMALLRHLDQEQAQGQPRYDNKGQLIKTAGQLRDDIGRENVRDTIDPDEWFD